jgi:hypothetical protein
MTAAEIINQALLSIGEDFSTLAAPVTMTRADILAYINILYQNKIGKALKRLTLYQYDASDGAHTITAGIGALPADFLAPYRVYDGTIDAGTLLTQIFDIGEKVDDDDTTLQYILPTNTAIWIYGKTPTGNINLYYYAKPVALTDSAGSIPTALSEEFHVTPFVYEIKRQYAVRNDNVGDAYDLEVILESLVKDIEFEHALNDIQPDKIVDCYGGL